MYALTLPDLRLVRSVDDGTTTPQQAEQIAATAYASWQQLETNGDLLNQAVEMARISIEQALAQARSQVERALETVRAENEAHKARFEAMDDAWQNWAEPSDAFMQAYDNTGTDVDDAVDEAESFLDWAYI